MAVVALVYLTHSGLPAWLQAPHWFLPLARTLGHFVTQHQGLGLFLVIFLEELGIPLPAPGDVAITWGGYLTTTGSIPLPIAYLAVIGGATAGSFCLYSLSRRYGHPFLVRFGPYLGLYSDRLERAESAFRRWGPWAIIIGRHIPGMRIVLSAFSGAFDIPARMFVLSVLVSATIWAGIFLSLGRVLGVHSHLLFRLLPLHLLPLAILVIVIVYGLWLTYDRVGRSRKATKRAAAGEPASQPGPRAGKARS
jgi:membrane protein DedA with SNARE-associated domain